MGTYIYVEMKNPSDKRAKELNKAWFEMFPEEKEEAQYKENFYGSEQGPTFRLTTAKDLMDSAIYFRDKQGFDVGLRTGCRTDLGFRPDMSDKQALAVYKEQFNSWAKVGMFDLKLSGEHFCKHKLKRLQKFLKAHKDEFNVQGGNLAKYSGKCGTTWASSAYCSKCKAEAEKKGVTLPINAGAGSKGVGYYIDALGKDVAHLVNSTF